MLKYELPSDDLLRSRDVAREIKLYPLEMLTSLYRKQGDFACFRIDERKCYLVSSPRAIWIILSSGSRAFRAGRALTTGTEIFRNGILASEGQLHQTRRKLVAPAFSPGVTASFAPSIIRHTISASNLITQGKVLDMFYFARRLALTILGDVVFGVDFAARVDALIEDVATIFGPTNPSMRLFAGRTPPANEHIRTCLVKARENLENTVGWILAKWLSTGAPRTALARVLDGCAHSELLPADIRDEAMTMLLAGHQTISTTLAWAWWLTASNQEVERKLCDEADAAALSRGDQIHVQADMTWTRAILLETLRLYPPVWVISRVARQDVSLEGCKIEAGSEILISPWVVHRSERNFAEPTRFNPERWRSGKTPEGFLPFGGGERGCFGEPFAMLEMDIILRTTARKWSFNPAPGLQVEPDPAAVLAPKGPVRLTAVARRMDQPSSKLDVRN